MKNDRKLNSIEQSMELLNRHQGAWNVIVISYIKGNLNENTLRKSLDIVQFRHPRLRSQIIDRGSLDELYFVEPKNTIKIPLQTILLGQEKLWQSVAVSELNCAIDSDLCLMKCFLIRQQDNEDSIYLITKIHHAISDGLSATKLHLEIIQNCQKIESKVTVDSVKELPTIPPLEKVWSKWMNGKLGNINKLLFILRLQLKQKLYPLSNSTVEKLVPLKDRSCGMVHRCLNPDITQRLIYACRQEKTTVQGALCAAMMFAVVNDIEKSQTDKTNLICNSYVDMRRRVKPQIEQEHLAVMACFLTTFHKANNKTPFWHLARDVYQQNKKGLRRGDVFKPAKFLREIIEYYLTNCDRIPISVGVTNIGKIEALEDCGQLQLKSINFVAANPIFPGSILAAVTTYKQNMYFNFTFSKPSISQQKAESMVNYSINLLSTVC